MCSRLCCCYFCIFLILPATRAFLHVWFRGVCCPNQERRYVLLHWIVWGFAGSFWTIMPLSIVVFRWDTDWTALLVRYTPSTLCRGCCCWSWSRGGGLRTGGWGSTDLFSCRFWFSVCRWCVCFWWFVRSGCYCKNLASQFLAKDIPLKSCSRRNGSCVGLGRGPRAAFMGSEPRIPGFSCRNRWSFPRRRCRSWVFVLRLSCFCYVFCWVVFRRRWWFVCSWWSGCVFVYLLHVLWGAYEVGVIFEAFFLEYFEFEIIDGFAYSGVDVSFYFVVVEKGDLVGDRDIHLWIII